MPKAKYFPLLFLLAFAFLLSKVNAQTYTPIAVTGFNCDVIAETSPATTSTTMAMDLQLHIMYSQTFATANSISGGLINTGTIVSGTRTYQLQSFTANNALHVQSGTPQTMTLTTPAQFSQLSMLGLSTEQFSTITLTVNFTNSTSTSFSNINVQDWFLGTGSVYSGFGRIVQASSAYVVSGYPTDPELYPFDMTLSCADRQKLVQSITITVTGQGGANSSVFMFGLSGTSDSTHVTSTVTNVGCSGGNTGSATVNATGTASPYTYSWNTTPVQTTATATSLGVGNHICTISDAAGCAVENDTVTVATVANPVITITATHDTVCSGNSTVLTVAGLSTLTWFPTGYTTTSISVTPTTTTNYHVIGVGTNGCSGQDSFKIVVDTLPLIHITPASAAICKNSNVQLNSVPSLTYAWSPSVGLSATNIANPLASPTVSKTYYLTATNGNGCIAHDSVHITVYALPTVTATANPSTVCAGDSVHLATTGLTNFSWTPGAYSTSTVLVFPATTTTYTVSGTDTHNCTGQASATVTINTSPTLNLSSIAPTVCANSSVNITASGATSYVWSPATGLSSTTSATVSASPTITTTYFVKATTTGIACTTTKQVVVTVNQLPIVSVVASAPTICNGASTQLSVTNLTNFTWNPGGQTITPITVSPATPTTYSVSGTDANGCSGSGTVAVNVQVAPTINISSYDSSVCAGSSIILTANGGASSYTWQPGNLSGVSVSVTPAIGTTYTATGIFYGSCQVTASLFINVFSRSNALFIASPLTGCAPLNVKLTNQSSNANAYHWLFSDGGSSFLSFPNHTFNAGIWDVTLIANNANNCPDTLTIPHYITVNPKPTANFSTTPIFNTPIEVTNATIQFNNLTNGTNTYVWTFGDNTSSTLTNPSHTYSTPGDYSITLIATNGFGCPDSTTYGVVEVIAPLHISAPSAFTPNGDDHNDKFNMIFQPLLQSMDLKIYNRWGQLVYETTDIKSGWDGTFNGEPQPIGVYTYAISATFNDGRTATKQGNVTLLR